MDGLFSTNVPANLFGCLDHLSEPARMREITEYIFFLLTGIEATDSMAWLPGYIAGIHTSAVHVVCLDLFHEPWATLVAVGDLGGCPETRTEKHCKL